MARRRSFRFLAAVVSGQPDQWREDHRERSAADQQQSDYCFKDGGQHLTTKRYLSRSAIPSTANQVGSPNRDQGHGGQAGPLGLPDAPLRNQICGQRSNLLPASTPPTTD